MKSTLEEVTGNKLQNKPRQAVLKANGKLETIEYNDQIVEVVKCNECGIDHLTHQRSYLELAGNLHVGGGGGLLGNGDWKNIGVPVYYFCINNQCLSEYMRKAELEELTSIGQISKITNLTVFEVGVPVAINCEYFLKPHNRYSVCSKHDGRVTLEGMVYSMKIEGEYAKHMRVGAKEIQIQEWMVKGIVQVMPDTVVPDPNERP